MNVKILIRYNHLQKINKTIISFTKDNLELFGNAG